LSCWKNGSLGKATAGGGTGSKRQDRKRVAVAGSKRRGNRSGKSRGTEERCG
jgi:hypothetical protein